MYQIIVTRNFVTPVVMEKFSFSYHYPRVTFFVYFSMISIRRARLSNVTPEKNIKYHLIIINDIKIEKHGESDEFNYLNLEQRVMLNILLLRG